MVNGLSKAMSSSIKINSISIELAGATNRIDMAKCDHFSIRGFVAGALEKNRRMCWPFSEESVSLVDQQSFSLPFLSLPKSRWWRCMTCTNYINVAGKTNDCGNAKSKTTSEKELDENTSVIPSTQSLTVVADQEKDKEAVVEGDAAAATNKDVVLSEVAQKENQTSEAATTLLKKVHTRTKVVRRKRSRGNATKSSVENTGSKEKQTEDHHAVTNLGSPEIAGVIEDTTPPLPLLVRDNVPSSEGKDQAASVKKPRKVRFITDLLARDDNKTSGDGSEAAKEDSASKKDESVRGQKRKLLVAENKPDDQGLDESTDAIKGKKRNRRFQVVDELVPSLQESAAADLGKAALPPSPLLKRKDTVSVGVKKKLSLSKKEKKKLTDNRTSDLVGLLVERNDQSKRLKLQTPPPPPPPTRALSNEKKQDSGVNVSSSRSVAEEEANCLLEFASSCKSNADGGLLKAGAADALTSLKIGGITSSTSTQVADPSSVLQKDASVVDRKGKAVMVEAEEESDEMDDDIYLTPRNPYEWPLPNKEKDVTTTKQPPQEPPQKAKKPLLIDLNEVYIVEDEEEDNNNPPVVAQPKPSVITAKKKDERRLPIRRQQKPPLDILSVARRPTPFVSFPTTHQENRSASSVRYPGHNYSQWFGNNAPAPTANQYPSLSSYPVLRGCNSYQSSAPHHQPSHPVWPPSEVPPPGFFNQKLPHQQASINMHQFTNQSMFTQATGGSPNQWNNLNSVSAAANGNANYASSASRFPFSCNPASSAGVRNVHLFNLMNPGRQLPPRPNPPADRPGNTMFTKRHFPPANQVDTRESSKSKQLSFDLYRKRIAAETPRRSVYPPIIPRPATASFQDAAEALWLQHQNKTLKRKRIPPPVFGSNNNNNSNNQVRFQPPLLQESSNSVRDKRQKRNIASSSNASTVPPPGNPHMAVREKRNIASSSNASTVPPPPGNAHMAVREKRNIASSSNASTVPPPGNAHVAVREKRNIASSSNASTMPPPGNAHVAVREKRNVASCSNASTVPPPGNAPEPPIICKLNRNPADFISPGPHNPFMLSGRDLRGRKRGPYKKKPKQTKKPDA